MTYTKVNFVNGSTPLNAATLGQMDQGIADDNAVIEAMPAIRSTATVTTDWNTAITNGWFRGSPGANAPTAFAGSLLIGRVEVAAGFVTQTVWQYALARDTLAPRYQRRYDGNWGTWNLVEAGGGGGSTDLVYNGEYPAATPYTDGDIVIYQGQAYMCVRPTAAAPVPWAGAYVPGLTKLTEVVLASASPTLLDFTVPAGYTDLIIRGMCRSDQSANQTVYMRFNGDSGANYDMQDIRASAATASGAASAGVGTGFYLCIFPGTAVLAGQSAIFEARIPFYTDTAFHKAAQWQQGYGAGWAMVGQGSWRNTAAINRIVLYASGGNFVAGSRVAVWGQR